MVHGAVFGSSLVKFPAEEANRKGHVVDGLFNSDPGTDVYGGSESGARAWE